MDTAIWHAAIGESGSQGPYSALEVRDLVESGTLDLETPVWRDGFEDWRPLNEVDELLAVVHGEVDAPAETPQSEPELGPDPFADEAASVDPRMSAEQAMTPGAQQEGTIQISLDEIRALSSGSPAASTAGSTTLTGSPSPGYAGGDDSGLIDIRSLEQAQGDEGAAGAAARTDSLVDLKASPLDSIAPVSVANAQAAGGRSPQGMWIALATFGMVLFAGVAVFAILYEPEQPPAAAAVAAAKLPTPSAAADDLTPEPEPTPEPTAPVAEATQEDPTAAQPEPAAAQPSAPPPTAAAQPVKVTAKKAKAKAAKGAAPPAKRAALPAKKAARKGAAAKSEGAAGGPKPAAKPRKASASIDDILKADAPRKSKGGDSLDALMSGAVGKGAAKDKRNKKPAAKASGDSLKASPTRADVMKAFSKPGAKVKKCGGKGVAVTAVTVSGSTGKITKVSASGVTGKVKSCVESAVKAARFPKFKKDSFSVKFPFKL